MTGINRRMHAPRTGRIVLVAACLAILAAARTADAQVIIKMATLVPDGSSWHQVLKETAAQWQKVSGGKVQVRRTRAARPVTIRTSCGR